MGIKVGLIIVKRLTRIITTSNNKLNQLSQNDDK